MQVSNRLAKVNPSATLAMSQKTNELKAAGADVINLTMGQPDFETPKFIEQAAIDSINAGQASFYTQATGLPELRAAISGNIERRTGYHYDTNQIIATDGAKFALYCLFNAILNPGDGVIIPTPGWVSYVEQVRLAGGVPQAAPASTGFKVTVDDLDQVVNQHTKALIINSPQNPSGTIYSRQELTLIGNWALRHDVMIVSDEIYSDLTYNGADAPSMLSLDPTISANTILIGGVSKSYAMTGWRIGYAAAPIAVAKAMATICSHATGNPAAVSQYGAIAAFNSDGSSTETMRLAFEDRLNTIYPLFNQIPGFKLEEKPTGAFYLFINVKDAVTNLGYDSADAFAMDLLEKTGVAVVPGRSFGNPNYIRISYAAAKDSLLEAANRIADFVTGSSTPHTAND
ncbi:pyridoxal phosphate-dependent aminotransferase [Lacticaseibacillus pantheris]